ncbi:hypothetical protein C2845_PM03G09530 [Panicum miliaceum]|uniref:FBD domain-containing protein n=1 Tax=Panicum miliaceum TaxID=4540 RepID=A0A3L6TFG0_PANMI|nr:hypothetical protein C2845_PM03G09530 [Panicum miliaceum]
MDLCEIAEAGRHLQAPAAGGQSAIPSASNPAPVIFACPSDCPCTWPESYRNDNISLDSLEELEINGFTGKDHQLDCVNLLVNLLVGCNAPLLRVVFRLPPRDFLECSNIIRDKIRGMLPPGTQLRTCLEHRKSFGILDEFNLYA